MKLGCHSWSDYWLITMKISLKVIEIEKITQWKDVQREEKWSHDWAQKVEKKLEDEKGQPVSE